MATSNVSFEELAATTPPATTPESQATPVAAAEPPAATTPAFTEADAEAYRALADLGITPTTAKDFIEAKTALNNLSNILQSNPRLFLQEIEKTNPTLARTIKQEFSDAWFEDYQRTHPDEGTPAATGGTSRPASPDPEITQIKQQLATLIEQQNQERTQKFQENIKSKFNSALDDSLGKLPESVTELQRDHIRLKAQDLLWKDEAAAARVAKGVNVDVSKYIAKATSLVTAETKAAADTEAEKREKVRVRGSQTIVPAAEAVGGAETETGPEGDRIWDAPLTQAEAAKLKDAFR